MKIMKKVLFILTFLIIFSSITQAEYPAYKGYVNDFAGVIQSQDKSLLELLIADLKKKTGAEVAVVTVKSLDNESVDTYAVNLFEKWKIGQKGKDTGVLILLSVADRKVRIEVGYGLEGAIPDGLAGKIIDNAMIPYLKSEDFSSGMTEGTLQVLNIVAREFNVKLNAGQQKRRQPQRKKGSLLGSILKLLLFIVFAPFLFRSGLWVFFIPGFGGSWAGGRGGFGGGFGGFGGGMSGGGGASRGF